MIKVKDLSKEYFPGETLFERVNFVLSGNEKVALVGPNGCGKTTLLKIMAGLEDKSMGAVLIESERMGYLPQELDLPFDKLIGEFIENLITKMGKKHVVDSLITRMGLEKLDLYREISSLSGGEQMKLKLIETLLDGPSCLLLDEPTNHLDIDGILWFERFIKDFKGNVLMISHDRSFLNNTVSKIFEIENKEFHVFEGNYDSYQASKKKFVEKRNEEYVRFLKKKQKLEELLVLAHKIVGGKSGAVSAAKSRYKREIVVGKVEKYETKKIKDLALLGETHQGKLIVEAESLVKMYSGRKVLDGIDFEIRGKDKVWLFGPNGAGKSTLVKLIYSAYLKNKKDSSSRGIFEEDIYPDGGILKLGVNFRLGYFAQSNEPLNLDQTVLDFFLANSSLEKGEVFGVLRKFLFEKELIKRKLKTLSPGERARLKLALFTVNDYDFLILDEPTNHLDIAAKEVVEEALKSYKGALLLVSHDRYFVSEVGVDKVFELRNGKLNTLGSFI